MTLARQNKIWKVFFTYDRKRFWAGFLGVDEYPKLVVFVVWYILESASFFVSIQWLTKDAAPAYVLKL